MNMIDIVHNINNLPRNDTEQNAVTDERNTMSNERSAVNSDMKITIINYRKLIRAVVTIIFDERVKALSR